MKKWFRKLLPAKGSVLVFSLLVLSFLLVTALSVAMVSLSEQKSTSATDKSSLSFQTADSGAEIVLQKFYKGAQYANLDKLASSIDASCENGVITGTSAGTYAVSFFKNDGSPYDQCNDSKWRDEIVSLHSEGTYANTRRAVEVAVAAEGKLQMSCTGSDSYIVCCQLDRSTGEVKCKTTTSSTVDWTNFAYEPWVRSGTTGNYGLTCEYSGSGSHFVNCCRYSEVNGDSQCKVTESSNNSWSDYSHQPW